MSHEINNNVNNHVSLQCPEICKTQTDNLKKINLESDQFNCTSKNYDYFFIQGVSWLDG